MGFIKMKINLQGLEPISVTKKPALKIGDPGLDPWDHPHMPRST